MTPIKENPATRADAGRAPKLLILADSVSENIPPHSNFQLLFLARRGVPPARANLLASLAFATVEAAR